MSQINKNKFNTDILKTKKNAMQSFFSDVVTTEYPLPVEQACELLNGALATEIMCMLRYRQHQITVKGMNYPQISAEFEEHAEEEETHFLMIAKRIHQLGGIPNFNPTAAIKNTNEFSSASTLEEMIQENLVAERIAIAVYKKLIQWFGEKDSTTRQMLEVILQKEEEHASDLANYMIPQKKNYKELA